MADRETIIKGLEWWVKHQEGEVLPLAYSAVVETLEVLKEQEAIPIKVDEYGNKRCGSCGHKLHWADPDSYCCKCGKAVKWDD